MLVVFLLWKISSTVKRQKSYKFSDVPPPSDSLRRCTLFLAEVSHVYMYGCSSLSPLISFLSLIHSPSTTFLSQLSYSPSTFTLPSLFPLLLPPLPFPPLPFPPLPLPPLPLLPFISFPFPPKFLPVILSCRESSRSDKTLLEHDQNRNGQQQFLTQPSISSQNSSSDQDTPNTANTVISENSPFTFTPPVSAHTLEYPRSASLGSMGRSFHMYPIPEHSPVTHPYIPPNAHQHTHTLPNHWQIHPYPISDTRQQDNQEVFEMIENPSNQRFEEEKVQ